MKIEDTFYILKHHYAPAGTPFEQYRISDVALEKIVSELNLNGVMVNPDYSLKKVVFEILRESRCGSTSVSSESTVPLYTVFPSTVRIDVNRVHLFDSRGLEIVLENYDNVTTQPDEGMMGGSYGGEFGISCQVKIDSHKPHFEMIETVKKVITDLYVKSKGGLVNYLEEFD